MAERLRLTPEDTIIGMDLGSQQHQVVVIGMEGQRRTRFIVSHSREGLLELVRRARSSRISSHGRLVFAFEATGHFWEAVAHFLVQRGLAYLVVNPLVTFRMREARQMSREKTDLADAEQIAELVRGGLVTYTQLERAPYLNLRRTWSEYQRLRYERARLKTLLRHQVHGLFPELLRIWSDICPATSTFTC